MSVEPLRSIDVEKRDRVAIVTINNPREHNALTIPMFGQVPEIFAELHKDMDLRAIFLRGAQGRFTAGARINDFREAAKSPEAARDFWRVENEATKAIENCRHPVVAMVERFALGAGMDIADACDTRYATSESIWGVPAAKVGVTYSFAAQARLASMVGVSRASWILVEGETFSATEAKGMGLVNVVMENDQVDAQIERMTALYGYQLAPLAVRDAKRINVALRRAAIPPGADDDLPPWGGSQDVVEGTTAFTEKRKPVFLGI